MAKMHCRLCSSDNLSFYYTVGNDQQFHFYKCRNCGLVNLDMNGIFILDNQRKYEQKSNGNTDPAKDWGSRMTHAYIMKKIPGTGDYLDIGAGTGALLKLAKEQGWNVQGLELSPFLSEYIRTRYSIPMETADFLEYQTERKFDLITLRHVLEHLPDPLLAMFKINNLLKPNAFAVLEFPNIEGWAFKMKRFLSSLGLYKKKFAVDFVPAHCNEYSKKSFRFLCDQTGFKLIDWGTYSRKKWSFFNGLKVGTKARALIQKQTG